MQEFDRIIGLGTFCLTKFQINRHICRKYFGLSENSTLLASRLVNVAPKDVLSRINGGNCVYDWVVVENFNKLSAEIESGLSYRLDPAHLHEVYDKNNKIDKLRCSKSGVLWVHLFSKQNNLVDWVDQIPELQPKLDKLISNFRMLNQHSTAYVATTTPAGVFGEFPDRLHAALKKFRGPDAPEFALVIGSSVRGELPKDRPGIFFRGINLEEPDFPQYSWLGNAASWDGIFEFTFSEPVREEWLKIAEQVERV